VDVSSSDEEQDDAGVAAFDAPDASARAVGDLLRAAAAQDGPMPADVVARLDAALGAARVETRIASLDHRRRRARRWNRVLAAAAGVVVLGGGGYLASQADLGGGAASSTSAGSAADAPAMSSGGVERKDASGPVAVPDPPVVSSGADYGDPAALQAGAAAVVAASGRPVPGSPGSDRTRLSSPQDAAGEDRGDPAVAQSLSCAQAAGVDPATVLGIDLAQWRGTPAAVVVSPAGPGRVQVTVLARDCVPGEAPLAAQAVAGPVP